MVVRDSHLHSIHLRNKISLILLISSEDESKASLHVNSMDMEALGVEEGGEVVGGDSVGAEVSYEDADLGLSGDGFFSAFDGHGGHDVEG